MARKIDENDNRREDEDLVMRDDDHGIRREDRNRQRPMNDRDRDVAQRWEREQLRGRDGFEDTDFRMRGAPGDWDATGRFDDEEAFYSGSVRDQGGDLAGSDGARDSASADTDTQRGESHAFFRDEEHNLDGSQDAGRSRDWPRDAQGRRDQHRRDSGDRR